jgi:hypothetical protein
MGFLLFPEMLLELFHPALQVRVNLKVPLDDTLHVVDVVIDVVVNLTDTLDVWDKLTFLSQKLSCFFKVLKMLVSQLLFFLYDPIYLLMESQESLWVNHLFSGVQSNGALEVVPIFFLLLLEFPILIRLALLSCITNSNPFRALPLFLNWLLLRLP